MAIFLLLKNVKIQCCFFALLYSKVVLKVNSRLEIVIVRITLDLLSIIALLNCQRLLFLLHTSSESRLRCTLFWGDLYRYVKDTRCHLLNDVIKGGFSFFSQEGWKNLRWSASHAICHS